MIRPKGMDTYPMANVVARPVVAEVSPLQIVKNLLRPIAPEVLTRSTTLRSWRQYRHDFGYFPNVFTPTTFNEKIQARKLFDRRPLFALWADKMAVRDWVAKIAGPGVLPKLHYVTRDASTIPFDALPNRYVVKGSHGSGWVRIVRGESSVDRNELRAECEHWLSLNYADVNHERIYREIEPRIMVEEFLENDAGDVPEDFKFYTFAGNVRVIQVDLGRFGTHRRNLYDRNWSRLRVQLTVPNYPGEVKRPSTLDDMIRLAETLSGGIDFVRVDLYQTAHGIRFGEMTSSSGNGLNRFSPVEFDRLMGAYWKVKRWGPYENKTRENMIRCQNKNAIPHG